jgi:hypothetical protein
MGNYFSVKERARLFTILHNNLPCGIFMVEQKTKTKRIDN